MNDLNENSLRPRPIRRWSYIYSYCLRMVFIHKSRATAVGYSVCSDDNGIKLLLFYYNNNNNNIIIKIIIIQ